MNKKHFRKTIFAALITAFLCGCNNTSNGNTAIEPEFNDNTTIESASENGVEVTTERKDIIGESDTVTEKDENMNGSNMTVDVNGSLNESIDNQEDFDGISVSPEMKKVLIGENMLIAVDSDDTGNTDMMLFDGLKEYYGLPNNEYREFWVQDIDMDGTAEVGFVIYDYIFLFHQVDDNVYVYKENGRKMQSVYDDGTVEASGGYASKIRYQVTGFGKDDFFERKLFGHNYIQDADGGRMAYYKYTDGDGQECVEISEDEYNALAREYSDNEVKNIPYSKDNVMGITVE